MHRIVPKKYSVPPDRSLLSRLSSVAGRRPAEVKMLERGDAVPHFEARTVEGERFSYASIWQRKNLLLVTVPTDSDSTEADIAELSARIRALGDHDLEHVITRDSIPGISGVARGSEVNRVVGRLNSLFTATLGRTGPAACAEAHRV